MDYHSWAIRRGVVEKRLGLPFLLGFSLAFFRIHESSSVHNHFVACHPSGTAPNFAEKAVRILSV